MGKIELIKRWENISEVHIKCILECFANGVQALEHLSPFGIHENRIDLRGLEICFEKGKGCGRIKGCQFKNIDFTAASFDNAWIEGNVFDNVVFDEADMQGFRDLGNVYRNCTFIKTDLSAAGLGYDGSSYNNCTFRTVKFGRTSCIRPEFNDCVFRYCKMKGVDFNGGSCVNCRFIGKIENVWFRGGFPLEEFNQEYGPPRRNRMENVSFEEASVWGLTFSDSCDLSSIILPNKGDYRLYSDWKKRLLVLKKEFEKLPKDKNEGLIYSEIHLVHAEKQDWYLVNCCEIKKDYGEEIGNLIIQTLDSAYYI